jgi:VCBS repeat-containing protein
VTVAFTITGSGSGRGGFNFDDFHFGIGDDTGGVSAELAASAEHGVVTLNADGSFSYVPSANFNGVDSFGYVATAGSIRSDIATVTISVNSVNDPPFFNPDG